MQYIAIHDGFLTTSVWDGFLQGSDRIMMDKHDYFAFTGPQPSPLDIVGPSGVLGGKWPMTACSAWGGSTNNRSVKVHYDSRNTDNSHSSRSTFGVTFVGEFSASPNDCGLFLHGVNIEAQTPNCSLYDDWAVYTSHMKQGIQDFAMASMDAFGDWFFWTWKVRSPCC